jgi:hypothetical protein
MASGWSVGGGDDVMDEIVFARETLRRALLAAAETLEQASSSYDPEDDFPTVDLLAVLTAESLRLAFDDYGKAIKHRIDSRVDAKRGKR